MREKYIVVAVVVVVVLYTRSTSSSTWSSSAHRTIINNGSAQHHATRQKERYVHIIHRYIVYRNIIKILYRYAMHLYVYHEALYIISFIHKPHHYNRILYYVETVYIKYTARKQKDKRGKIYEYERMRKRKE